MSNDDTSPQVPRDGGPTAQDRAGSSPLSSPAVTGPTGELPTTDAALPSTDEDVRTATTDEPLPAWTSATPGGPVPVVTPERAGGRPNRSGDRDLVRTAARGIGQLLITAGVVVLLFVVYEVWITDIFSGEKQAAATQQLDTSWDSTTVAPTAAAEPSSADTVASTKVVTVTDPNQLVVDPRTRQPTYQAFTGQGFAKIYIPVFGADYVYTIIEGTNADDLDVGPGHYADTQFPGQAGNFAMAGHRVSKGSPFNELGQLSSCDAMVIETKDDWFVYRVLPMDTEVAAWKSTAHAHCAGVSPLTGAYAQVTGREITDPSDYAQVLPVPQVDSAVVPKNALRLITLTTCHPQFSDAQRMIIHGVLVKSYKKASGFLPPELKES